MSAADLALLAIATGGDATALALRECVRCAQPADRLRFHLFWLEWRVLESSRNMAEAQPWVGRLITQ